MKQVMLMAVVLLILVGLTILLIVGLQRVDESSQGSRTVVPEAIA